MKIGRCELSSGNGHAKARPYIPRFLNQWFDFSARGAIMFWKRTIFLKIVGVVSILSFILNFFKTFFSQSALSVCKEVVIL